MDDFLKHVLAGYALDPWFAIACNLKKLTQTKGLWFYQQAARVMVLDIDTLRANIVREKLEPSYQRSHQMREDSGVNSPFVLLVWIC